MNCDEVRQLYDAYLDSELDAKTSLEIREHLAACAECARFLAAEAKLDAHLTTGLRQGQRTSALWEKIEREVVAMDKSEPPLRSSPRAPRAPEWLAALLWPHPKAWAGLAAAWVFILAANFATRETSPTLAAHRAVPLSPDTLRLLKQQEQLLAELSGRFEPREADRPKTTMPRPHTERRNGMLNA